MKVAVACEKEKVTEHFGHCEHFLVCEIENNRIINHKSVPNPGHKPGFLPNFLSDLGVNVIISGGMGGAAIDIFNENGIDVFTGVEGDAIDSVISYLKGSLESTGSVCNKHEHHGECGE
jgi:predicted Fe-Mo cluster-binding NifX family protein